jgi:XTP/dITP diphosphohydrolase
LKIVFATNNKHKLEEINALLDGKFDIIGLKEVGIEEEVPEDHATLEENALQKARYIYNRTGENCFADDTGLEVGALDGEPGVYSARYSRIGHPVFPEMEATEGNIRKLLLKLEGVENREAQFRTVIALIISGSEYQFEGVIKGEIKSEPSGSMGFGYDPVFIPEGTRQTFAEMALSEKNRISHRARAVRKLAQFLMEM